MASGLRLCPLSVLSSSEVPSLETIVIGQLVSSCVVMPEAALLTKLAMTSEFLGTAPIMVLMCRQNLFSALMGTSVTLAMFLTLFTITCRSP